MDKLDNNGRPASANNGHISMDTSHQASSDMVIDSEVEALDSKSNQMVLDSELQATSGISTQLVPEFSRKLSFIEVGDEFDADKNTVECGHHVHNSADNVSSSIRDTPKVSDTASTATYDKSEFSSGEAKQWFVCVCGEGFEKSVQLAAHKRWSCKLKEKTAQCDVCNNWFASDMGLKRHMKHAHGGAHSCDSCNLRFPNKIKLTRHWMEAHCQENQDKKLLKCFECGDTNFDNKLELECHLVLHKFEKHQEKLAHNVSMSHHSGIHFTPYHSPPFLRAMRPLHPFHHPYGFGPQWSHFPFRPTPPLFPFMPYLPFRPPFPMPPTRPYQFGPNLKPFFSGKDDDSSVRSAKEDTASGTSSKVTNETSTNNAQSETDLPSRNPHHNHEYVEPTAFPCFFHQGNEFKQHKLHRHRHHDHHHHIKKKWKKYLKLMMKGQVPDLLAERFVPTQGQESQNDGSVGATHQEGSDNIDKHNNDDNCEFQMACKFCEKVIEKNKVVWHQKKECPVLSAHQCNVCDRVFKKRHFLIRHIHEQKHYCSPGSTVPPGDQTNDCFNSLSNLQEKMNASLQLLNVHEDVVNAGQMADHPATQKQDNRSNPEAAQFSHKEMCASQMDKDRKLLGRTVIDNSQSNRFRCATCMLVCQSIENLMVHLTEHINQVLAVQKVREWTSKSSEYFFMGHLDEDDELEGSESVSTATTSYIDSEITSTASSALHDASGNLSSLETSESTWIKPHKKRGKHRHKGEINVCDFCGERFAFRKELHYHMEANHKESTLECPVCQKKFSWKKRGKFYERHLNSHYGVKIFKHKCSYCGKTFLENSKLRSHMSLHNSELLHKCTVCDKGYANKSSLVRHERTHTGVKPYQCDICHESFMEKRELLRHSTTHTGLAPFSCSLCGQGFTLKTSLMSHMKKRHSKKDLPINI